MRNLFVILLSLLFINSNPQARGNNAFQWFEGSVDQAFDSALQQQQAPFHGRNTRAVQRVNKSLAEWAKTDPQKKLAEHFRSSVHTLCLSRNSKTQCTMLETDKS